MTKIVATALLALLLPVAAGASGVEGKAIICLEEIDDPSAEFIPEDYPTAQVYRGFKFVEEYQVEGYILRHTDSISRVERFDEGDRHRRYEFAEVIIFWNDWSLDRKTLVLSFTGYTGAVEYSCEVFNNFDEYEKAFEKYRKQEQKAIDRIMEGNRI